MTTPKKPLKRRDATGHLDPAYQRDLLNKARETHNDAVDEEAAHAFIADTAETGEELSEELGEAFLQTATSGEEAELERLDRVTAEENGGPFVPSSAREEFAAGTDESNIEEATREPLPRTSKAEP